MERRWLWWDWGGRWWEWDEESDGGGSGVVSAGLCRSKLSGNHLGLIRHVFPP